MPGDSLIKDRPMGMNKIQKMNKIIRQEIRELCKYGLGGNIQAISDYFLYRPDSKHVALDTVYEVLVEHKTASAARESQLTKEVDIITENFLKLESKMLVQTAYYRNMEINAEAMRESNNEAGKSLAELQDVINLLQEEAVARQFQIDVMVKLVTIAGQPQESAYEY